MSRIRSIAFAIVAAMFLVSAVASGQTISIVSGNGQLACEACPTIPITQFNPLVVQVKDASARPLPGATVTWTTSSVQAAQITVTSGTTITDANGMASNTVFVAPLLGSLFGRSFVQGTVTAALTALPPGTPGSAGQSVTFTETDALTDIQVTGTGQGIVEVQSVLTSPPPGSTLTGPAGSTLTSPTITVQLSGILGGGVPGVAVYLVQPTDPTQPSISCATTPGAQPNSVLTDASGAATCTVVFGGRVGPGTASIAVGQVSPLPFSLFTNAISFNVGSGIPGSIQVFGGNNQSGNAGTQLPLPLVAVVQDQAGNPLPNATVTWTVSPASAATLLAQRNTSDANGRVSTYLVLGSTPGPVTVTVAIQGLSTVAANFTETVNLNVTQLQKIAGDNQIAATGTAFPNPLIVQVNNGAQPVANVTVTFSVTSGSATLSSATATTNVAGQAQVTVTAGSTVGPAAVTATVASFSATFNLTVQPPGPSITPSSFQNAASGVVGAISPCSLATIVAPGLAPGLQGAILPPLTGQLPVLLGNDSVGFLNPTTNNTSYAPIYDLVNMNGQESMTIEIPCDLPAGNVSVTVNVGSTSKTVTVQLQGAAPGIFQTAGSDKKLRAVIVRSDGSYAFKENPVQKGETVYLFVTGLGPLQPQIGTNQVGNPSTAYNVSDSIVVGVNNAGVPVVSATYAQNLIGIYMVAFTVPTDTPSGDIPLAIAVSLGGNLVFGNGSVIPVQ